MCGEGRGEACMVKGGGRCVAKRGHVWRGCVCVCGKRGMCMAKGDVCGKEGGMCGEGGCVLW